MSGICKTGGNGEMDMARNMKQTMAMEKKTNNARLITNTLDTLNTDPMSGKSNSDYDFQKSVLSAGVLSGMNINKKT